MDMTTMHRDDRRDDYAFISGSRPQPWYSRYKRKIVWGGAATLVVLAIIVFIAASKSKRKSPNTPENPEVFTLRWEGECPWEPEECPQSFQGRPPLLLVSLDGFRAEYLRRGFSPVLNRIAECGARAPHMFPVYPSKTFPNHFSIVTGLHPSSHGVVDNSMMDGDRLFKLGNDQETLDPFWWEKEPIWVTAVKQGLKAATFFWPGSDVKINGSYPTYYKKYNSDVLFEERVDQVLSWLDLPEDQRPSFLTLYFNEPDTEGHAHGINAKEVDAALVRVDGMVERLFAGLQNRNLTGCINVILLSDHGMSNINCSRAINIEKYVNVSEVSSFLGTFGRLRIKESSNTSEAQLLSELQCKEPHMRAYRKEQLPLRMHYSAHRRIEPVILELDSGWTVMDYEAKPDDKKCSGGAHGYDNMYPDMRALFVATGPSIKKNVTIDPFMNIELYELMCELLNITSKPNNGTRGSLHDLLVDPTPLSPREAPHPPITATVEPDPTEYEKRVTAAQCQCKQSQKQVDFPDTSALERLHLPFGGPSLGGENDSLRLLFHHDFVSAYHADLLMPLWSSFTVYYKNITDYLQEVCWTGDARLYHDEVVRCSDYNSTVFEEEHILQRPLYPEHFSSSAYVEEARFATNSVPKSSEHANHLEERVNGLLMDKARRNGPLNIVAGPAFDLAATEVRPSTEDFRKAHEKYGRLIVPTHIFVVATWCKVEVDHLRNCLNSSLDSHAFLLPNHPYPQTCEPPEMVITRNVARVVDVEALTGLSFYPDLPQQVSVRLRTEVPQVRL